MGLTIITKKNGWESRFSIHMPLKNKNIETVNINIREVIEVVADGDELGHILSHFRNIPLPNNFDINSMDPTPRGYMMKWYGDHAKFIVGNL